MDDLRGKRLFSELNQAFKKDPLIDEYEFIPVLEPERNVSPLVLERHKLGFEIWGVQILYMYSYSTLMKWRSAKRAEFFLDPEDVILFSRAILLVNPECYTVWNVRKELVESGDLSVLDDIRLGQLIFSKFPKSAETFAHRRWLLRRLTNQFLSSCSNEHTACCHLHGNDAVLLCQICNIHTHKSGYDDDMCRAAGITANVSMSSTKSTSQFSADYLVAELTICQQASDKHPSNYYSWEHRKWVVQCCTGLPLQTLLSELDCTRMWCTKHVSDHSGFHYRQFLLKTLPRHHDQLLSCHSKTPGHFLTAEHGNICDLIQSYPGYQAMWYHRFGHVWSEHSVISHDPLFFNSLTKNRDADTITGRWGNDSINDMQSLNGLLQWLLKVFLEGVRQSQSPPILYWSWVYNRTRAVVHMMMMNFTSCSTSGSVRPKHSNSDDTDYTEDHTYCWPDDCKAFCIIKREIDSVRNMILLTKDAYQHYLACQYLRWIELVFCCIDNRI